MVLLPRFPEVPNSYLWVVSSQAFWSLFCIIGWLIGTYLFWFLVFLGMPPWIVLIPTWLCYMSRGSQALRNLQVSWPSYFLRLPSDFSNLWGLGWAFSFLHFMRSESCPFMDLGPSLWTFNGFGPLLFFSLLEVQMFYFPGLQSFALFWALVQSLWFFNLNTE